MALHQHVKWWMHYMTTGTFLFLTDDRREKPAQSRASPSWSRRATASRKRFKLRHADVEWKYSTTVGAC